MYWVAKYCIQLFFWLFWCRPKKYNLRWHHRIVWWPCHMIQYSTTVCASSWSLQRKRIASYSTVTAGSERAALFSNNLYCCRRMTLLYCSTDMLQNLSTVPNTFFYWTKFLSRQVLRTVGVYSTVQTSKLCCMVAAQCDRTILRSSTVDVQLLSTLVEHPQWLHRKTAQVSFNCNFPISKKAQIHSEEKYHSVL